jgi:hypothetical protein
MKKRQRKRVSARGSEEQEQCAREQIRQGFVRASRPLGNLGSTQWLRRVLMDQELTTVIACAREGDPLALELLRERARALRQSGIEAPPELVYRREDSDPYMILSVADPRRVAGVSAAEIDVVPVWWLISDLKVGEHGAAYVLDAQDRVIVYSATYLGGPRALASKVGDLSLFQRDFSGLPQVQAARAAASGPTRVHAARDINGRVVLSASASVAGPDWHVFVELPLAEADTAVP